MTVDISFPEDGELSDADRETVDDLVDRLCSVTGVDESGLPSLSVERTDTSVILRPDAPMFTVDCGTRFHVRAVSRNDNGTNVTSNYHAPRTQDQ